jgi:hypothetical protein
VVNGIQDWTVPITGSYQIQAYGASGGSQQPYGAGGNGAMMQGTFMLTAGTVLQILVGQMGENGQAYTSGAGGGSFVVLSNNTALLVAAGGGTNGNCGMGIGLDGSVAMGNGSGGLSTNNGTWCGCGGEGSGGGGFSGDGEANGGLAFVHGGTGATGIRTGQCIPVGYGGFGGGGNSGNGGGGGGGYQGGNAGGPEEVNSNAGGQGGFSYNTGTNQSSLAGHHMGDGTVTITFL